MITQVPNVFLEEGHGKHILNSSLVQNIFESLNGMEVKMCLTGPKVRLPTVNHDMVVKVTFS